MQVERIQWDFDAWEEYCQWQQTRPNLSYGETKIFDKNFDQLFRREYPPENIQALNVLFRTLYAKWDKDNPMGLHEADFVK